MERLRDLFFIIDPDDLAALKKSMKDRGMGDDAINQKLSFDRQYVLRRVRRLVPSPAVLLRELDDLVAVFANVLDAKNGQPFFRKQAWSLYNTTKSMHVKKGCISDMPGVSYCVWNLSPTLNSRHDAVMMSPTPST